MKRTLSLLALIAALLPLSPLTAVGTEQHIVQGITFQNPGEWSTATGWYDANKSWYEKDDSLLCWAATCSNLITWWQIQNGNETVKLSDVWDEYRDTFVNGSGIISTGLKWWFDGSGTGTAEHELHLRPGVTNPGGHYKENLADGIVESGKQNILTLSTTTYGNATDLSKALTSYIDKGYAVGVNFISGQMGHAETIWGVECDETGLITTVYLADSDDTKNKPDVPAIRTEPVIVKDLNGKKVLALQYSDSWSVESVVVLTPTLSNDVKYLNYVDDNSNVILKQKVGAGYTLPEDTESINNIVYDGSRGSVDRQLTVDAAHDGLQAGEIQAAPTSGTNLLEVMEGVTLTARDVTGPGTLVKTGKGTLAIGNSQTTIEVRGGTLAGVGTLGEVILGNGTRLENQGTATKLTVNSGSVAEMKNNSGQQAFTQATVNDGGTLKGSGQFGKVTLEKGGTLVVGNAPVRQTYTDELIVNGGTLVFSIDDALNSYNGAADADNSGWGSGRYSTISMSSKSLTLNPDEIKINLGETILKRSAGVSDLEDALGTPFTINLANVDILMDINYNNPLFDFYTSEAELQRLAGITTFSLSDEDGAFSIPGLQAIITPESVAYATKFSSDVMLNARLSVTLVAAPEVPEPTTGTLSLLALAALAARRRRH